MKRFKNRLIVGAVFALLVTIGSLMNLHQAAAQGPPTGLAVNIVNPVPVPVSITGSNGITGTVQVANTPTSAVPTVAAPAASQLYRASCTGSYDGRDIAACFFPTVPAGQTLF